MIMGSPNLERTLPFLETMMEIKTAEKYHDIMVDDLRKWEMCIVTNMSCIAISMLQRLENIEKLLEDNKFLKWLRTNEQRHSKS